MKNKILIACLVLLSVGCSRQVLNLDSNQFRSSNVEKSREMISPFYISGLGQTNVIDAARICGGAGKVSSVETVYTPYNYFIGAITFGIYTPRTYQVSCNR